VQFTYFFQYIRYEIELKFFFAGDKKRFRTLIVCRRCCLVYNHPMYEWNKNLCYWVRKTDVNSDVVNYNEALIRLLRCVAEQVSPSVYYLPSLRWRHIVEFDRKQLYHPQISI